MSFLNVVCNYSMLCLVNYVISFYRMSSHVGAIAGVNALIGKVFQQPKGDLVSCLVYFVNFVKFSFVNNCVRNS